MKVKQGRSCILEPNCILRSAPSSITLVNEDDIITSNGYNGYSGSNNPIDVWNKKMVMFRQPITYDAHYRVEWENSNGLVPALHITYDAGATFRWITESGNTIASQDCYETNGDHESICILTSVQTDDNVLILEIDSYHTNWLWLGNFEWLETCPDKDDEYIAINNFLKESSLSITTQGNKINFVYTTIIPPDIFKIQPAINGCDYDWVNDGNTFSSNDKSSTVLDKCFEKSITSEHIVYTNTGTLSLLYDNTIEW